MLALEISKNMQRFLDVAARKNIFMAFPRHGQCSSFSEEQKNYASKIQTEESQLANH